MFISSIATKFLHKEKYYYALSKEKAEEIVANSGLNTCIVRPTIVIGRESSLWQNFKRLATAPLPFVFGNGAVKIQPIFVGDLVDCLFAILKEGYFHNEAYDLGGPEQITMENFIKMIRKHYHQRDSRILHLPLRPLIAVLSLFERLAYSLLPVNVGQFFSFFNDSIIGENRLANQRAAQMKDGDAMLKAVTENGKC